MAVFVEAQSLGEEFKLKDTSVIEGIAELEQAEDLVSQFRVLIHMYAKGNTLTIYRPMRI